MKGTYSGYSSAFKGLFKYLYLNYEQKTHSNSFNKKYILYRLEKVKMCGQMCYL